MARLSTQIGSYLVAVSVADVVFTAIEFAWLMSVNIPKWGGFPLGIVASDVLVSIVTAVLQWPVILAFSALPFLVALMIQRTTRAVSLAIFLLTGAAIGGLCSVAAYFFVFREGPFKAEVGNPIFYFTHSGAFAVFSGIVGAFVYWRMTMSRAVLQGPADTINVGT